MPFLLQSSPESFGLGSTADRGAARVLLPPSAMPSKQNQTETDVSDQGAESNAPLGVLIFDFDGTLAETLEEALRIANDLAPKYGFPTMDGEKVERLRGLRTRQVIREIGIRPRLIPKFLAEVKAELRRRVEHIKLVRGIPSNLEKLRKQGVCMGILTSNSRDNVEAILERAKLSGYFAFLETGSPLFGKARLLRKILRSHLAGLRERGVPVIYVGDETRDIEAARKVGIKTAAVCWGANNRQALESMEPDYLLDHPAELAELVAAAP